MTSKQERTQDPTNGFFRPPGAARFLGISRRTLTEWERKRIIPFTKVSHRVVLFSREDLERAMRRYRVAAIGEEVAHA